MASNLDRTLAYLKKLPAAVSGSGGHDATWRAALACRRFGLTDGEMRQALDWYNENKCQPPWSEKELKHKMDSVSKVQVSRPMGSRGPGPKPVTAEQLLERQARRRARRGATPRRPGWDEPPALIGRRDSAGAHCVVCDGVNYWFNLAGEGVCRTCHPPAAEFDSGLAAHGNQR